MHARSAFSHVDLPLHAHRWPTTAWVAVGGSALALADLLFAAIYWHFHSSLAPARIGQGIASWVVGSQAAKAGGLDAAIAGVLLYCAIVAAMVAGYMRLTTLWPRLHRHVLSAGIAYGVAMYALLFQVFVPHLSAATVKPGGMPLSWTLGCIAAYAGIGIGCAAIARARAR